MLRLVLLRLLASVAAAGLAFAMATVNAQDAEQEKFNQPRTQGEIMKERADACRGLKGAALKECLANYVGPKHDAAAQSAGGEPSPEEPASTAPHPPPPAAGDPDADRARERSAPK
jgi:hypothetical protein